MKFLIVLMCAVGIVFGADLNNTKITGYMINKMGTDSLKVTPGFKLGDYEGLSFVIKSPVRDSSLFIVCFQRGYMDNDGNIVWKRPSMLVDTFNTLVAGNFQAVGSYVNAVSDTDLVGALDSLQYAGSVIMARNVTPYRAPYGRFTFKGITGNRVALYNFSISVNQTKYYRVDVGTSRQPE
jgi:hypothetical protein